MNKVDSKARGNYRDRIYKAYVNTTSGRSFSHSTVDLDWQARQYRQRWASFLPTDHNAPILDLACGCGEFIYFLQKEGYTNVRGVDISPEQIEAARSIGAKQVEIADALTFLRLHLNSYALVNAQNLLEHFKPNELLKLLDAICASLQPGGTMLAVVPNAASPWGMRTRYWDITHELSFTPSSMTQVLVAVGFTDFRFLEYGPVVHGIVSGTRMFLWQMIRLLLKAYLLIEVASTKDAILTQDMRIIARKPLS